MSLKKNRELKEIAKIRCRELRKDSTKAEKIFWEHVRNRKYLGLKFNRQFPIFVDILSQETFYIADFYCHEKRLVVELDGKLHDFRKVQDKLRTEVINTKGLWVVRFRNEEVELNCAKVLEELKDLLTHPKSFS
ncbi:MAG: endonuclease domain-containing protein [Ignavibacteriae bacterium]|nr:endonuclease domain-containing protein [Ignavibacteriota bacterium]